jgi:hypothetical protein
MPNFKKIVLLLVLITGHGMVFSQATRSPFTERGIGDVYDGALVHNQGMGGLGYSFANAWYLNQMNPALLPANTLTTIGAGFLSERRVVNNGSERETNGGGNLSYLALAFPLKPGKWGTSLTLSPYTYVNYKFDYNEGVAGAEEGVTADVSEQGFGGFNQLNWSHGVRLNKNFNVGLKATYIFSSYTRDYESTLRGTDPVSLYTTAIKDRVSISDINFTAGVSYRKDSIFKTKTTFNLGLILGHGSDANAQHLRVLERRNLNGTAILADTLVDNERGTIVLPRTIGVGFSFNKGYKWIVGADLRLQEWSTYRNFAEPSSFSNTVKATIGGEFSPDPSAIGSFWKRVTYRTGFNYETLPYSINGIQVKEIGINFGVSVPVSRISSIDVAFKYGRRGSVNETILSEDYFRLYFGVTLNDQWFVKRKFD